MVQRVAGHQDAVFQFYAPKMYDYCRERVASLLDHHDDLDRPFTNSIYTTFTVNMGPSSACTEHVDNLNSAEVMCGVTSAGRYDHTKGGHLVLYDLKVIIEFPSGWTAFLPSATLRHGNTAIQAGETRYAITQYIPGGLFRWVRHGFRLAKNLSEVERLAMEGTSDDRLRMAYGLFSKFDELVKDRKPFT
ncbi:uncharacterized protein STEHIDRAFT_132829 [Stereum hirsutum FP-91666 SS1]|uniref:uncharacterized protein n=1 Tax=Stereum hirsutum (strain FP-91666) TaxID=721885 RepID=UPI0004449D95|nr:uncharacterized protein STEHIDRAFT_132829 [Stereum hirsutum FP-91666 SS1]EIM84578.1 hypothetical protein STEHIDRAFT_132829 [Stereum hirsutum FP-91666 SS1]